MARTTKTQTTTPQEKPTMTLGAITFAVVDAPAARVRSAADNPLVEGVKQAVTMMHTDPGKGLSFTVPLDEVTKHVNWLRKAGRELNVSIRIVVDEETGKIDFRAMPKVERPRAKK